MNRAPRLHRRTALSASIALNLPSQFSSSKPERHVDSEQATRSADCHVDMFRSELLYESNGEFRTPRQHSTPVAEQMCPLIDLSRPYARLCTKCSIPKSSATDFVA